MSLDEPQDIPLKDQLKEKFYAKIEYLSCPELVHKLFAKWKWQGYDLENFEQDQVHHFSILFQSDQDKHGLGYHGPKLKPLEEQLTNFNLLEVKMSHNDEHDLTLYFGAFSLHSLECSIPIDFFHDSSCDPILDVLMIFLKDHLTFIPSLKCELQPSINVLFMCVSLESFYPSIILGNEYLSSYYFDKVGKSILTSFIKSLDMNDATYLLVLKQLEDVYHMHIGKSVEVNINDDPTHYKIIYLGDVLDADERVIATNLLKKYDYIFIFGYQDMLGMDSNVMMHNIVIKLDTKPIKQKPRCINLAQYLQIKE